MTVPTLAEIREAIVATAQAGIQAEVFEYNNVPDVTQLPAVVVRPLSCKYVVDMGKNATYEFQLYVLTSRRDTDTAQDDLDGFVSHYGTNSIPRAINDNDDLGIDGVSALCYAMDGYGGQYSSAQIQHVGAILKIRVEADP